MSYVSKNDFNIQQLTQAFGGYVGLPIPQAPDVEAFNGLVNRYREQQNNVGLTGPPNILGAETHMPLIFNYTSTSDANPIKDSFTFQIEPKVWVSGKNKITKRYVNRKNQGGSIKERWVQDDYTIKIKGFLISLTDKSYPALQVSLLNKFCHDFVELNVLHPKLGLRGLDRLVIASLDMPYTPGVHAQEYTITAYSDTLFNQLLIKT